MDNDQITALAREYAEETLKEADLPNCLSNETIDSLISEAEHKFRWLLRRYCLVEKSKATDLCRLTLEHDDSADYGLIDGLTDLVLEIFPEQYHQVADNPEIAKKQDP